MPTWLHRVCDNLLPDCTGFVITFYKHSAEFAKSFICLHLYSTSHYIVRSTPLFMLFVGRLNAVALYLGSLFKKHSKYFATHIGAYNVITFLSYLFYYWHLCRSLKCEWKENGLLNKKNNIEVHQIKFNTQTNHQSRCHID